MHSSRLFFRALSTFHNSGLQDSFWIPHFVPVNITPASSFSSFLPCSAFYSGFYSLPDIQMEALLLPPHLTVQLNSFVVTEVWMLS